MGAGVATVVGALIGKAMIEQALIMDIDLVDTQYDMLQSFVDTGLV